MFDRFPKGTAGPHFSILRIVYFLLLTIDEIFGLPSNLTGTGLIQNSGSAEPTIAPYVNGSTHITNGTRKSQYVIYPKDGSDSMQTNATNRCLERIIGKNQTNVVVSPFRGVELWGPKLDVNGLKQATNCTGVGLTFKNEDAASRSHPRRQSAQELSSTNDSRADAGSLLKKRKATIKSQAGASDDLKVLAQPSPSPLSKVKHYVYDDKAGEGSYIYVMEKGIRPDNADFTDMVHPPKSSDWLFTPTTKPSYTDWSPGGHGSCVASKAAGAKSGVAKRARLVIATRSDNSAYEIVASMNMVYDHILRHKRQRKAVVLFALGWPVPSKKGKPDPQPWPKIKEIWEKMFEDDIIIVNSSGNDGDAPGRSDVDTVPTLYESHKFPLIVVSTVDNEGNLPIEKKGDPSWAQGPSHVSLWAPGVDVPCANYKTRGQRSGTGTSPSAGTVAGALAYFLSLDPPPFKVGKGNTAEYAKEFLKSKASWVRNKDEKQKPNVLWNLLDGTKDPE